MTGFVINRLLIAIKVPTETERRPPKLDGLLGWQISDSCDRQYLIIQLGPMPAYARLWLNVKVNARWS